MSKSVTMSDIAKVMNVSTVTVSKALSGQKGVSEDLRAKIIRQAEEMGYQTSRAVYLDQLKNNTSYNIGVLVSDKFLDVYDSFYWKLYQETAKAAVQKKCFTMLEVLQAEDEQQYVMPKLLQENKADGLIIIGLLAKEYLKRLHEYAKVPILYLDFYSKDKECDAVISDSYYGMYKMTDYLFQIGHKEIGFVGSILATDSITDRHCGYLKALLEHGVEVRKDWILDDRDVMSGRTDVGFEIKLPDKMPTAFVCNCDVAAALLIRKLKEKGYRVPEDISVVGYDNYQPPGLCDIPITSYEVDMYGMAKQAIKKMIRKISGGQYRQGVVIMEGQIQYKGSAVERKA